MKPEERKERLLKLATEMANKGELKITPDCAEYQLLDYLLTDDELHLAHHSKLFICQQIVEQLILGAIRSDLKLALVRHL